MWDIGNKIFALNLINFVQISSIPGAVILQRISVFCYFLFSDRDLIT